MLTLTFNRPHRRNAWSIEMEEEYFDLLAAADDDERVRAIVVTATGPSFCPGLDVERLGAKASGVPAPQRRRPISFPLTMRKPMVAAINGAAAGLGLVHAVLCDIRFASPGVKLATSFTRRGLVAEHLLSWMLPRMVGHAHASDLLLSGRVVLAEDAAAMGLVNAIVPASGLVAHAQAYAADLARNCSPLSMAQVKRQLLAEWGNSPLESLALSDLLKHDPQRMTELSEGVASLVERRSPSFAPLSPASTMSISGGLAS